MNTTVPLPRHARNAISVSTFHPQNGGPHPDLQTAQLEWARTIAPDTCEAIGGLRATIAASPDAPGGDILIRFTLAADQAPRVRSGQFVRSTAPVYVWDGKYSNGYRNHAFEVTTPDVSRTARWRNVGRGVY